MNTMCDRTTPNYWNLREQILIFDMRNRLFSASSHGSTRYLHTCLESFCSWRSCPRYQQGTYDISPKVRGTRACLILLLVIRLATVVYATTRVNAQDRTHGIDAHFGYDANQNSLFSARSIGRQAKRQELATSNVGSAK